MDLKSVPAPRPPSPTSSREVWLRALAALVLLFIFLVGIRGLGEGFKGLGKDLLDSFFTTTANPFMGLVLGILATTLVQSSSVTTSMIVAMVAAEALPVANAVPMIMGANIGTTVTATLVALAQMGRPDEFRRAFGAATVHDFFNFITVAVLLPIEIATGYLEKSSAAIGRLLGTGGAPGKLPNPIKEATKAALDPFAELIDSVASSPKVAAMILIIVSAFVIYGALYMLVSTLRALMATRMRTYIRRALDSNAYAGIVVGIVVTVSVQSSSITTSVVVPLAGAGIVTVAQVLPITVGANIGTTITAILASMATPEETAHLAVQIATVHMLFNLTGTVMIYPLKRTRAIPVWLAERLATFAVRSKKGAITTVLAIFYGIPALLIFLSRSL